ncbi:unnamed protein product [Schistosoma margrebowiei]|uniref:Round spermatid basic protein 1-like protein n=1 Tax=Schistosoma margrebowiei TaxID=48269 RepID=A0A183MT89_9TREM|nr:unnamed protein product [Schistosoma margrebowiei]VDP30986.1 unnamed protein product [Schistosoma margrebowiei]
MKAQKLASHRESTNKSKEKIKNRKRLATGLDNVAGSNSSCHAVVTSSNRHDPLAHIIRLSSNLKVPRSPKRHLCDMIHVEHYENGGGYALHSYADELAHLTADELALLARKYFKILFTERRKRGIRVPFSHYCIGVVHGAARRMPELLSYLSSAYPNLNVSTNPLEQKNATETLSLSQYVKNVQKTYANGIYRFGPLHALSIVGVKGEERGFFDKSLIEMIEKDPFLKLVTPWGVLSSLSGMDPRESNDGPILWSRHGEQTIPLFPTTMRGRRRVINGCITDVVIGRRALGGRQIAVHDRTNCHADHADDGLSRHTTAAVGLLKAVYPHRPGEESELPYSSSCPLHFEDANGDLSSNTNPYAYKLNQPARIVKDVVVFDPRHYVDLIERLRLDIMEPPASQCGSFWADDGELNQLHSEGFRYVRLPLRDNDIYFIPRNVVHQFKSVSAVSSIAWHVRLKNYYDQLQHDDTSGMSEHNDSDLKNLDHAYQSSESIKSTSELSVLNDINTNSNLKKSPESIHSSANELAS